MRVTMWKPLRFLRLMAVTLLSAALWVTPPTPALADPPTCSWSDVKKAADDFAKPILKCGDQFADPVFDLFVLPAITVAVQFDAGKVFCNEVANIMSELQSIIDQATEIDKATKF